MVFKPFQQKMKKHKHKYAIGYNC